MKAWSNLPECLLKYIEVKGCVQVLNRRLSNSADMENHGEYLQQLWFIPTSEKKAIGDIILAMSFSQNKCKKAYLNQTVMENCWPLWLNLIYSCKFEFDKLFLGKWHQVRKFEPIIPVGMSFGSQKAVKWSKWNDQSSSLPSEYSFRNWALRRKITIFVYVNVYTPHQKTGWFLKFLQFCLWKTNESMRFNDPRRRNIDWLQCSWEN